MNVSYMSHFEYQNVHLGLKLPAMALWLQLAAEIYVLLSQRLGWLTAVNNIFDSAVTRQSEQHFTYALLDR